MADTKTLQWDDPSIDVGESVTEEDIKGAEQMGSKIPVGKFLCTCVDSIPKQKDFNDYSCIAAGLKWRIDQVVELGTKQEDGSWKFKQVEGDEGEPWEGMFIYDDINMPSSKEKDGMRKRRILVAKRAGLISDTSMGITKEMWSRDILGKRALITQEEQTWEDKKTKLMKSSVRVAFDGYDYADSAKEITEDAYEDI